MLKLSQLLSIVPILVLLLLVSQTKAFSPASSSSSSPIKQTHQLKTPKKNQHFSTATTSGLFNYDVNLESKRNGGFASMSTTATGASSTAAMISSNSSSSNNGTINPIKAKVIKAGMLSYIASMCVALPTTLLPVSLLHRAKVISTLQKEQLSCRIGCFCSRWLMRLIPFAHVQVVNSNHVESSKPEPTIWVCNHTSMLDIFFLLAKDRKLRGRNKRPIKIIYWKDLEKNPITRLLFTMSGFIPVEMEDNGNGNANTYKKASFKTLLKSIKKAFEDGFDIGILPEGQLNPSPEKGLQPIFGGAYTLSKISKRPIKMMAIHGLHNLWHGDEKIGMKVAGRKVTMRNYNLGGKFSDSDEFVEAFKNVVGHFGATGSDLPGWREWIMGMAKKEDEGVSVASY